MAKSRAVLSECGHGFVRNPCTITIAPLRVCQACARGCALESVGVVSAIVPTVAATADTITLMRTAAGFVYLSHHAAAAPGSES